MNNMINFPGQRREPSADDMIASEVQKMYMELGCDSFAARRHEESLYVALAYVHDYWNGLHPGKDQPLSAGDVAGLDCHVVAEYMAADLGPDGRAGVERIVAILIQHARKFLAEYRSSLTPAIGIADPNQESAAINNRSMRRLTTSLAKGLTYTVRGTVEVDLTVNFMSDESASAA